MLDDEKASALYPSGKDLNGNSQEFCKKTKPNQNKTPKPTNQETNKKATNLQPKQTNKQTTKKTPILCKNTFTQMYQMK